MDRFLKPAAAATSMDPVLARLGALAPLTARETELVRSLAGRVERHAAGSELIAEGGPASLRFILSGWVSRQRILTDGRRQIFDFRPAGDPAGDCARAHGPALASFVALTAVTTVDAEPMCEAIASGACPNLARALALIATQEEAQLLDHIVRLGRQSAYERMAHLFLSLRGRLAAVGLADERRWSMPLTQETLADALGLSIVHVNRTLQQLRREKLVEMRGGAAILLEPKVLSALCDYRAA
jgi:CRP-like cAMP-binding protein